MMTVIRSFAATLAVLFVLSLLTQVAASGTAAQSHGKAGQGASVFRTNPKGKR